MWRACFVALLSACGARIDTSQEDARRSPSADASVDSMMNTPLADAAMDSGDPTHGCTRNLEPRTCWKCCEDVPELLAGAKAWSEFVLPCMCTTACSKECVRICEPPSFTTPYPECNPCLQAHDTECLEGVPSASLDAVRAFLACTHACPDTR
jgi:hypothetical protein